MFSLTDDLTRCGSSGGSVYSECSSSCQGHCRDKEVADTSCKEECVAGCTCPPGQVSSLKRALHVKSCISPDVDLSTLSGNLHAELSFLLSHIISSITRKSYQIW
ncbi:hypothetical protein DPMN_105629 [Dreissena polymorpha]|uniref:TIL domain-containing protein n=1 Tax=Dreissena polymorpha TaxID=45954 RepID=A0A9D4K3K0_DREPO|nr:hypothetical protein DPMN_105629 [Dreissena polymorpha]